MYILDFCLKLKLKFNKVLIKIVSFIVLSLAALELATTGRGVWSATNP